MGDTTSIEWTDSTWSPIRYRVKPDAAAIARAKGYTSLIPIVEKMAGRVGQHCEHVSPGCEHCYAETNNHRCLPANGTGLPYDRRSRDLVEPFIDQKVLLQPLKWKLVPVSRDTVVGPPGFRTKMKAQVNFETRPRRIFVENQSDLFGEWVPDDLLDQVFALMALCPQHLFQVLTKRPGRMKAYLDQILEEKDMHRWVNAALEIAEIAPRPAEVAQEHFEVFPLPNVWLGVSVENQAAADERIPLLLQTPAAVRFISAEPLLGLVDLEGEDADGCLYDREPNAEDMRRAAEAPLESATGTFDMQARYIRYGAPRIDWVICGGESGPGARPMHPDWARSLRDQCQAAGVPFFFKQWGDGGGGEGRQAAGQTFRQKKGGALLDGREWRQFPEVR